MSFFRRFHQPAERVISGRGHLLLPLEALAEAVTLALELDDVAPMGQAAGCPAPVVCLIHWCESAWFVAGGKLDSLRYSRREADSPADSLCHRW